MPTEDYLNEMSGQPWPVYEYTPRPPAEPVPPARVEIFANPGAGIAVRITRTNSGGYWVLGSTHPHTIRAAIREALPNLKISGPMRVRLQEHSHLGWPVMEVQL